MAVTLAQLLAGIRQEESGGNYNVVNSIGAVGAYQVMKANIPSWTRSALGHSLTWQQFRASKSAQDKVASYILGGYYRKYGAAGAASMWFSGQPNPNKSGSDGNTSISNYVKNVLSLASKSSGGSSGGGGGAVGSTAVTPKLSQDELASQYGLSSALINSSKELKSLFNKAVAGSWSADLFTAKLKNTKWWSTQPDTLRQYITDKYTDPATFKQKNNNELATIKAMAVSVGLVNGTWTQTLNKMVYNSIALGWSDDRIKDYLGGLTNSHDGEMFGEAGQNFDQMKTLGYDLGVTHSLEWYRDRTQEVTGGRSTMEAVEGSLRNAAAAKYSAFADQIKAGQNTLDLAAPYIQSVSKILEVPDTDIGLTNSHVMKAMTSNTKGQAQSIWDFENHLRQDPVWRKTQNAQDSMMQNAHQVLQQFGLAF